VGVFYLTKYLSYMKIVISDNQYSLLKESVAIKNIDGIKNHWKNQLKKGKKIRFDKEDLEFWGITTRQEKFYAQTAFQQLVGDEVFTKKFIKNLLNKTFSTKDFNDIINIGGYDFEWIITEMEYRDFDFYLYGKTLPGGTVTLMDGRHLSLDETTYDGDLYWEIQEEVNGVVQDCMDKIILPVTGYEVEVSSIVISEE
jgi:hypothetical protein